MLPGSFKHEVMDAALVTREKINVGDFMGFFALSAALARRILACLPCNRKSVLLEIRKIAKEICASHGYEEAEALEAASEFNVDDQFAFFYPVLNPMQLFCYALL